MMISLLCGHCLVKRRNGVEVPSLAKFRQAKQTAHGGGVLH
jgi:hypothetical protein